MSSSVFSDNSCALCARHRTPPNLNLHVSSGKTCADIHLELSLIDASKQSQKCLSGQNSYRSLCCQRQHKSFLSTEFKVTVGVIAGVMLIFFATKRVFSVKIDGEKSPFDYKKMPSKKEKSKSKQKSQKKKPCEEASEPVKKTEASAESGEEEDESMLAVWNGNNS